MKVSFAIFFSIITLSAFSQKNYVSKVWDWFEVEGIK